MLCKPSLQMPAHLEVDIKHVHQLARPLDPFQLARLGVLVAPIHPLHQAPPHQQLDKGAEALLLWLACSKRDSGSSLLLATSEGALTLPLWLTCSKREKRHSHAAPGLWLQGTALLWLACRKRGPIRTLPPKMQWAHRAQLCRITSRVHKFRACLGGKCLLRDGN